MCRNIKNLNNFEPPATDVEIHDAALQFVRKISGTQKPSLVNEEVFNTAIRDTEVALRKLVTGLKTTAPARNREIEAQKRIARSKARFS
jgi:hypothetical protein